MSDLTPIFEQGREARRNAGRCLEHGAPACPFYSSSPYGDAWQAGYGFECDRMAGNALAALPVRRAWAGRGYRVNVELDAPRRPRMSYAIEHRASAPDFARLET